MVKFSSKFTSKPSYDLYVQLWYTLDLYLFRINIYIYLNYYEWNVPRTKILKKLNINDINNLKQIYEYDYKVFKVLLFLYWDLEYYLEGTDYVKNTLIVDLENLTFLGLKFSNKCITDDEFLNKIKIKKPINLWTNLEIRGMLDKILKYDVYSKIDSLDTRLKKAAYIKEYKLYKKYNDLLTYEDIYYVRLKQAGDKIVNSLYYEDYIKEWYKEWYSEINKDLTKKYKEKIKVIDLEWKNLIESLGNTN